MDAPEMNKQLKADAGEDESQKKKIVLDESNKKKPTGEKVIELYDPGKYYLKDQRNNRRVSLKRACITLNYRPNAMLVAAGKAKMGGGIH